MAARTFEGLNLGGTAVQLQYQPDLWRGTECRAKGEQRRAGVFPRQAGSAVCHRQNSKWAFRLPGPHRLWCDEMRHDMDGTVKQLCETKLCKAAGGPDFVEVPVAASPVARGIRQFPRPIRDTVGINCLRQY